MKKTILINSLPMGRTRVFKSLGFLAFCLALVFCIGTQEASAQTPEGIGEAAYLHTIELLQTEILELRDEMANPPAGVNTEKNPALMNYYEAVIRAWKSGVHFRPLMMEKVYVMNEGSVPATADVAMKNAVNDGNWLLNPFSTDYRAYYMLVDAVNLEDLSDEDVYDVFHFLRTLKNQ